MAFDDVEYLVEDWKVLETGNSDNEYIRKYNLVKDNRKFLTDKSKKVFDLIDYKNLVRYNMIYDKYKDSDNTSVRIWVKVNPNEEAIARTYMFEEIIFTLEKIHSLLYKYFCEIRSKRMGS